METVEITAKENILVVEEKEKPAETQELGNGDDDNDQGDKTEKDPALKPEKQVVVQPTDQPVKKRNVRELMNKAYQHDFWIRSLDRSKTIFYYNTLTGETTWLPPCSSCNKPGEKWCLQCNSSFCDRHFMKKHLPPNNKDVGNSDRRSSLKGGKTADSFDPSFADHEFSTNEIATAPRVKLQEGQEYCLECFLHPATHLCRECSDPYCFSCFTKVHRIGALRYHFPMDITVARSSWYTVRGNANNPDYYINGKTNTSTFEKPVELMNRLERFFYENWQANQKTAEQLTKAIETLHFEVEKNKFDKDKMLVEMNEMAGNFNATMNLNSTAVDLDALFGSNQTQQSEYRQMLLNPSNRKRGQGRTKYIKDLLELPFPE
jgi:hypothetical protein